VFPFLFALSVSRSLPLSRPTQFQRASQQQRRKTINAGLQRAPQQQQLLPTTASHDSFSSDLHARPQQPQSPSSPTAPPEAEEKEMKSIAADPNGTDPGEEPENRSKRNNKENQLKSTACVAFFG